MNAPVPHRAGVDAGGARSRVLEALGRFRGDYVRTFGVDSERLHVLDRLLACRTGALGTHLRLCGDCGWWELAHNSCRDRHCPLCQSRDAAVWAAAREARMLSVAHFQVVFTLPADLRPLAFDNRAFLYDLLLRTSASVLQDLFRQHHDGRAGITTVLHTWTRELTYHPHVHCIVTAGALRDDGTWEPTRPHFLFPGKVMGQMFRGRFLEALIDALEAHELTTTDREETARLLHRLSSRLRRWVVHVEAPNGRSVSHITRYLAQYVKRVAISDTRIVSITATHVTFRGRRGLTTVSGAEFVHRFLLHVLPKGLRKVRHYGLYAPGAGRRLEEARQLTTSEADAGEEATLEEEEGERCPCCGVGAVRRVHGQQQITAVLRALARGRSNSARGPP